MTTRIKETPDSLSPFQEREQALRKIRALLERMRNRLNNLSGRQKRNARRAWKKVKSNRYKMKQAFYEVTLADRKKWEKVRPRIARTFRHAQEVLEHS